MAKYEVMIGMTSNYRMTVQADNEEEAGLIASEELSDRTEIMSRGLGWNSGSQRIKKVTQIIERRSHEVGQKESALN